MALAAAFADWWQRHLSDSQGRCLIGFSGGVDSTVLLHLAAACAEDRRALLALHIHHGLQPAADAFLTHCQQYAENLGVPFRSLHVAVQPQRQGPEASARRARYRAFVEQLAPDDVVLLGHHQDDQVETVLLRLLRGSGARGLAGMPARRTLGAGHLLRPLLAFTRDELLAYARAQRLPWIEDPTNARSEADRNYLRHAVLPALAERWPAYRRTISRAASLLAEEFNQKGVGGVPQQRSLYGEPVLDAAPLLALTMPERARCLRAWLLVAGCQPPPARRLREFLGQLETAAHDRSPLLQTTSYAVRFHAGHLHLTLAQLPCSPRLQPVQGQGSLRLAGVGELRCTGTIPLTAEFDFRRGGERCRIAGHTGHRSLKNVLQERSVPPWWRHRIPLLRIDGEICAVAKPGEPEPVAGQPGLRLLWLPDPGALSLPQ